LIRILSIESSGDVCSVALHTNHQLVDIIESTELNIHGEKLAVFVQEILQRNQLSVTDLAAIAVSEGPGSYTGLRIGVSLAKGLCYASEIPLIAVNTLQSLALAIKIQNPDLDTSSILLPMIDARRMEVYMAGFNLELNQVIETKPVILDENFELNLPSGYRFIAAGNGAKKLELIDSINPVKVLNDIMFSAKYIGDLASIKFEKQDFVDIAYFEPVYLKEFAVLLKKG